MAPRQHEYKFQITENTIINIKKEQKKDVNTRIKTVLLKKFQNIYLKWNNALITVLKFIAQTIK